MSDRRGQDRSRSGSRDRSRSLGSRLSDALHLRSRSRSRRRGGGDSNTAVAAAPPLPSLRGGPRGRPVARASYGRPDNRNISRPTLISSSTTFGSNITTGPPPAAGRAQTLAVRPARSPPRERQREIYPPPPRLRSRSRERSPPPPRRESIQPPVPRIPPRLRQPPQQRLPGPLDDGFASSSTAPPPTTAPQMQSRWSADTSVATTTIGSRSSTRTGSVQSGASQLPSPNARAAKTPAGTTARDYARTEATGGPPPATQTSGDWATQYERRLRRQSRAERISPPPRFSQSAADPRIDRESQSSRAPRPPSYERVEEEEEEEEDDLYNA